MLSATNLSIYYRDSVAVNDVSLTVHDDAVTTIIGVNGAGKSSLLAGLVGLERRSGKIVFDGEDISRRSPEQNARRGLILVPETRELFSSMSVADNLILGGASGRPISRRTLKPGLDSVYDRFPRLAARRRQLAGTLSGGERQMLALGRALMARPKLLMLDEPSLGLAPNIVQEMFEWIAALKSDGMAILLVEQNARMALRIAQTAYVMENGRFLIAGKGSEIARRDDIAARYLGKAKERQAVACSLPMLQVPEV